MTTGIDFDTWLGLRKLFLRHGFSPEEAEWAAENNLDPDGEKWYQVRRLLKNRKTLVRVMLEAKVGYLRNQGIYPDRTAIVGFRLDIIDKLDYARRRDATEAGYTDEMNLFVGET